MIMPSTKPMHNPFNPISMTSLLLSLLVLICFRFYMSQQNFGSLAKRVDSIAQ